MVAPVTTKDYVIIVKRRYLYIYLKHPSTKGIVYLGRVPVNLDYTQISEAQGKIKNGENIKHG